MNIDRPMVSLFFEIKRNLPHNDRPNMKISAPDVGDRLVDIYQSSDNPALKTLIKNFFNRAGEDWTDKLHLQKKTATMFYRGQAIE